MSDPKPEPNLLEALPLQQQKFVEAYVSECNGNASRAALKAGYGKTGARVAGSRLLTNVNIRNAIQWLYRQSSMGVDEIIGRLEGMARSSLYDGLEKKLLTFNDKKTGKERKRVVYQLTLEQMVESGLIDYVKTVRETKFGVVYELEDRQGALDKLARAKGVYREDGGSQEVIIKIVKGIDMEAI